jgi:hypothetical protein
VYDFVKWDVQIQAQKIKDDLVGGSELKDLWDHYFARKTWTAWPTNELDIVNSLYKIDERYNAGIKWDIDKIYDPVTWFVDGKRLDRAVEKVNKLRKQNFLTWKKIKPKKEFKNLKDELGYTERVSNSLFKEWKVQAQADFKVWLAKVEKRYKSKISKLKRWKKKLWDKYRGKLDELI